MLKYHRTSIFFVLFILLISLTPRLLAIPFGLPMEFDPDERIFTGAALRIVTQRTLDPSWYGAPASTLIYSLAVLFEISFYVSDFATREAFLQAYQNDVSSFFMIGRIFSAIIGVLSVLMSYFICLKVGLDRFWSLIASLLISASPMMLHYSSIIRMDMLQIFFSLAFLYLGMKALEDPKPTLFAGLGIYLGLATASKYPAVVMSLVGIAMVIKLKLCEEISNRRALYLLYISITYFFIAMFLSAPFVFLNFSSTLIQVAQEARSSHWEFTSAGFVSSLLGYLIDSLPESLSISVVVFGVVGLTCLTVRKTAWILPASFLIYLLFISLLPLYWPRWVLPLIPLCAIGSIYTLAITENRMLSYCRTKGVRRTIMGLLQFGIRLIGIVIFIVPVAARGYSEVYTRATNSDSRVDANEWIIQNIPKNSTVLLETYAPALAVDDFDVVIANNARFVRWTEVSEDARPHGFFSSIGTEMKAVERCDILRALDAAGVNYVVLSSWIRRFEGLGDAYRFEVGVYQSIIDAGEIMKSFIPSKNDAGPPIYIYRVKSAELFDGCGLGVWPGKL